ncbi:MAG TPA: hypothetical protein VEH31_03715 [Streptosporangiaceae bacterium]|nr:hypothetical protein [Streptosporangiaceae bacterium]
MTGPANDPQVVRPGVVLLLLDTAHAADDTDNGAAYHADGRRLDPGELALIRSRTPAEERAVAALIDAGWQRWHRRAKALARITAIIGEAPPLARANFDAALWACAVPRDLAAMTPREYAEWLDADAPLTARVARVVVLPELPTPLREEAERLLPVLDPVGA